MNDSKSTELVSRSSNSSTPTKPSYNKKEFHISQETPKTDNSVKKPSPTNQNLISNLKGFNIEKSKYKHYGHNSLMTAQALDKIINESHDSEGVKPEIPSQSKVITEERSESPDKAPKKVMEKDSSPESKAWSSDNKMIMDQTMKTLLKLPQESTTENVWPYTSETLTELLRFKTEQERTKQEEIKNEFASTTLNLLTLIKSMNISTDLIPKLLANNAISEMNDNIESLKNNPEELIPNYEKPTKRKYSDVERRYEQTELVSPMRSPQKLPSSTHRRLRSDDSENVRASRDHSPSSQSTSHHYGEPYLQQHSPNQISQPPPGMFPVYYAAPSKSAAPSGEPNTTAGSPYQQKYQPVVYHPPQGQPHYQSMSGSYGPPQQYYYVTSPHSQPGGQNQYPAPSMMTPLGSHHGVHYHHDSKEQEDYHMHKKQKSVTNIPKNSNINFMISTPKNPPARKYNHPKDK